MKAAAILRTRGAAVLRPYTVVLESPMHGGRFVLFVDRKRKGALGVAQRRYGPGRGEYAR